MKKRWLSIGILGIFGLGLYGGAIANGWSPGDGDELVYMPESGIRGGIIQMIEKNTLVETEDGMESTVKIENELPTIDQIKKYAYSDPNEYLQLGELGLSGIQGVQYLGENVKKLSLDEISYSDITPIFYMEYLEELKLRDVILTSAELSRLFTINNEMTNLKVLYVTDYEEPFKDFSRLRINEQYKNVLYQNSTIYPTLTLSSNEKELVIKNPIHLSDNNGGETTYSSKDKNFRLNGNELIWDLSNNETPQSFTWEYKLIEENRSIVFKGNVSVEVRFED